MKAVFVKISHRAIINSLNCPMSAIPTLPMEEVMKVNFSRLTTSHHGEI